MNMLDGLGFFDAELMRQTFNQHLHTKKSFTLLEFTLQDHYPFENPLQVKQCFFIVATVISGIKVTFDKKILTW